MAAFVYQPPVVPKAAAPKPTQTFRPAAESFTPKPVVQTTRPAAESFVPSPGTRTPVTPVVTTAKPKTTTPKAPTVTPPTDGGGYVPPVAPTKTIISRIPITDKDGNVIGYTLIYSDGTQGYEGNPEYQATIEAKGTTNVNVIKALLLSSGLPASLVDASVPFLQTLIKDGIDAQSAVDIYLNNKEFTTKTGTVLTSPFYTAYGFYNEGLTAKLSAGDLFNTVEGYKSTQTKYNLDAKFTSQEYIQKYLKNNISVATLDKNANRARLAAVNADPLVVSNLQQLGYIGSNADLTDFYLDPNVGMEKMQQNFNTAALSFEAVRRANTGITFNKANFEKLGAELTAKGYDEAQTQYVASQAYNTIGQTLKPEVGLSNIYEGKQAADAATIQSELEQEQLNSIESLRRKKLIELETRSFQGQTGNFTGRTTSFANYSSAGQI